MHVCLCVCVCLLNHITSNWLEITGRTVWLTVCLFVACLWLIFPFSVYILLPLS
jgi:hypothetical protein